MRQVYVLIEKSQGYMYRVIFLRQVRHRNLCITKHLITKRFGSCYSVRWQGRGGR